MENRRLARIAFFVLVILALFYFLPKGSVEADSGQRMLMGTLARIIAVARHRDIAQQGIAGAFAELEKIESLASVHRQDSEVSKINRLAFNEPVQVSDSTFEILQKALYYGRLTGGAFDVSVAPLVELWQSAAEANEVPAEEELNSALGRIGFEKIVLDANDKTVRLAADGMKLDMGGIAKGYAIDRAIEALKEGGVVGGMVDVGGDIRCFGTPAGGRKHWLIGLQDPDLEAEEQSLLNLKLNDAAVATSGDYRRFVLVGGEKHSHIIDTHTGRSAAAMSSVSVLSAKAADADVLATAVSVLGPDEGLELIDSLAGTEAIIISTAPDYEITATAGAIDYIDSCGSRVTYLPQGD